MARSDNPSGTITLHSGELRLERTDLSLTGRLLGLAIVRTYRSGYDHDGPLGYGWDATPFRLPQVPPSGNALPPARGGPVGREYGGLLAHRSFGGAQVSRTFSARGQTGQQLLLGAYGALMRQVRNGQVKVLPRRELLDLVVVNGRARGIVVRNLLTGEQERYAGDAVVLCTGGYANTYYLSTNAGNSNVTASWRCARRGAFFANPYYVQIHPTCIPETGGGQAKRTLMSESLRNDGRVWVPKKAGDKRAARDIPEAERE